MTWFNEVSRYVDSLDAASESRILTTPMGPWGDGLSCLVETAIGCDWTRTPERIARLHVRAFLSAGSRYDDLCERFGYDRVNAAIRSRILSNQARRALSGVQQMAEAL